MPHQGSPRLSPREKDCRNVSNGSEISIISAIIFVKDRNIILFYLLSIAFKPAFGISYDNLPCQS